MEKTGIKYLLTLFTVLICFVSGYSQSVRLSVQPAGLTPGPGDTFYLIVDTHNVNGEPSQPASVPGCKVMFVQRRKMSTFTQVVNGVSTTAIEASYAITLKAEKPGRYTFGPITVGGIRSNSVTYTIGSFSSSSPSASQPSSTQTGGPTLTNPGGSDIFLRATVSDSSPYEQQGIIYTVKLYTTYSSVFDWIAASSPSFGNCMYDPLNDISHSLTPESYNGKTYNTAVVAKYMIYPTQSGKAIIKGNSYTGSVGRSMEYEDPYFGRMVKTIPQQVSAKPNDIELNVRPLPGAENYDDVNGVGVFKVTAELLSKNFKTHQAAVVRYRVSGTGNLSFVSLPALSEKFPSELKFLKSEDKVDKASGETSGVVTFDCTFIPQKEGEFEIPALKFNFFDAAKGSWYTETTRSFKIKVGQGSARHDSSSSLSFNNKLQKPGKLLKTHVLYISRPLFVLWYAVPVVLLIIILIIYRKRVRMRSDIALLKRRKANSVARRRLKAAEKCMRRGERDKFYDVMLQSLWGYLSDKLGIPTSELTRDNVSGELSDAGIDDAVIEKLISLLDDCEFAKYANATGSDMQSTYSRACSVIDSLDSRLTINQKSL